jgi:plasmid stabilization system protein ParE
MPTTYRVIISPKAFADIDQIIEHVKQDSPANAAAMIDGMLAAALSLRMLPYRHRVYQHRKVAAKTVHAMPIPPLMLYYRVDETTHVVRVLTIRHGARRQPRRFER